MIGNNMTLTILTGKEKAAIHHLKTQDQRQIIPQDVSFIQIMLNASMIHVVCTILLKV